MEHTTTTDTDALLADVDALIERQSANRHSTGLIAAA